MRRALLATVFCLSALASVHAQPAPDGSSGQPPSGQGTPPSGPPPYAAPPGAPSQPGAAEQGGPGQKSHMSPRQRFEAANTTHDGRLTLDQANAAGWRPVIKHFSEIDKDHKGYVTLQDIKEWHQARRAAKAAAQSQYQGGAPAPAGSPPAGTPPPGTPNY